MRYWFLTGILSIFLSYSAKAQKKQIIDSLKQVLQTNLTDIQKVDTYNALASKYRRKEVILFKRYTNQAIQLAKKIKYAQGLYKGYAILSTGLRQKGEYEEATDIVKTLLAYVQKHRLIEIEAKAYFLLGVNYYLGCKYDLAIQYLEKALKKSGTFVSEKMQGKIYNYLGEVHSNQARYFDALRCFRIGLQKWQHIKYERGVGAICSNIGGVYETLGQYPKSLEFFQHTLRIGEKLQYSRMIVASYRNLARIYSRQKAYSKALRYSNQALDIAKKSKNKRLIANCYNAVGDIYYLQRKTNQSLEIFRRVLKLTLGLKSQERLASIYLRLGKCYADLQQRAQAINYFQEAYEIYNRLGAKGKGNDVLLVWGKACYKFGEPQKALKYLVPALKIAREIKSLDNVQASAVALADVYKTLGNHKEALSHYVLYKETNDRLFNRQNTRKLAFLEAEYAFGRKEDSLKLVQAKERVRFDEDIKNRKVTQLITYIVLGVLVILVSVLGLFYWSKQKSNQLLNAMNNQLNSSNTALQDANDALYQQREEALAQNQAIEEKSLLIAQVNEKMTKSIQAAKIVQDAALPVDELLKAHLHHYFLFYRPRDVVSGDFYWVGKSQDTTVVVVADCTGHGVPGAFMSMIGLMLFSRIVQVYNITEPGQILENLYQDLAQVLPQHKVKNQMGMDTSVVSLQKCANRQTKINFAGTGQALLYVNPKKPCLQTMKGNRVSEVKNKKATTHSVLVDEGTVFYLYSDGYIDQNNKLRKRYGSDQFKNLLYENHRLPMEQQKQKLEAVLEEYMEDSDQRDDILVMGVQV